ncbi:MAG: YceI family protein [Gammaproteobacteria bacterium]|nr:YceI family protein [Gammaproteobacteria bacterium]
MQRSLRRNKMNLINKSTVIFLLLIASMNYALAGNKYSVDSRNSVVNFSTIKKQYVVESAVFKHIEGNVSDLGDVEISIHLDSIDTKIPIRDSRIQKLFFKVVDFPKAVIKAKIDMKKIKSISYYRKMKIPATLTLYGKTKAIKLNVLVAKTYKSRLLITSMKPIIINASDYGIPAENLVKLAKTVGGLSLSNKAAVNFVLTFKKDKKTKK